MPFITLSSITPIINNFYTSKLEREIEREAMVDHNKPELFELNNGTMRVKILNYGCTVTSLFVLDKNGNPANVALGFDSLEPYLKGVSPYFGCIKGHVANRIKDGKFALNGIEYSLPIIKPPNSLHAMQ